MQNKTFFYSAIVGVIILSILLVRSLLDVYGDAGPQRYVHQNDVRGVEVTYTGETYTMSFEQQKEFIELLNVAVVVSKLSGERAPFTGLEKIIIFGFDTPEIELTPVDVSDENIFFRAPSIAPEGYLMDISAGEMKSLLEAVYAEKE